MRPALLACLSLPLMAACGFHLRGDLDLPPELARVQVTGADRELVESVSAALARVGAIVVDSASASFTDSTDSTHLAVRAAPLERAVLTTDANGRATAYTFSYTVFYTVTVSGSDGDGESARPTQSVSLQRSFDYAPTQQLQSEQEELFLASEMRREAAARIVRRLARL